MEDLFGIFRKAQESAGVQRDPDFDRVARNDPLVVARRGQEARNHQLPHLQAGARRAVLRQDFRADQGLRVQLRQVQAHAASRRGLRKVRRRSHSVQGPARAHGPYRPGRAGRAHLVPALAAVAHRHAARHDAQGTREGPLLRVLHRHRPRRDAAAVQGAADRAQISRGARAIRPTASRPRWAPRRFARCCATARRSTSWPKSCAPR